MGVFSRIPSAARVVLALCVTGASFVPVHAQTTLVMPAGPLLPARFAQWQGEVEAAACTDCLHPDGVTDSIFKEDGLSRSAQQTYRQPGKPDTIKVEAYQFGDATGAYSAFTYLRRPEMKGLPSARRVGSEMASNSGGEFVVLSGTTVVKALVSNVRPSTADELKQLASTLPKVGGPKGISPLLPAYLPARGLETDSVRYALGPLGYREMKGVLPPEIIGFDKAAEVVTAKYADRGTLTILLFPTPQ